MRRAWTTSRFPDRRGGMVLLVGIIGGWLMTGPARGIDPDIAKLLREAPAPGDMMNARSLPTLPPNFFTPREELSPEAKTEKYQFLSKLVHVRIPELLFQHTPGRVAFQQLAEQSVALDPQHQGVIFVFDLPAPQDKSLDQTVSLTLRDVRLEDAILYLTVALHLRFEVVENRVVIRAPK